jgi:hypothetical protein
MKETRRIVGWSESRDKRRHWDYTGVYHLLVVRPLHLNVAVAACGTQTMLGGLVEKEIDSMRRCRKCEASRQKIQRAA